MDIKPLNILQPMTPGTTPALSSAANAASFAKLLKTGTSPTSPQSAGLDAPKDDPVKKAHDAAAGLVSTALIMPVLKQLRRSPFNTSGPFSAGTGEKSFGPQFDMQMADRIAHSPRMGATNALAARLLKRAQTQATPVLKTEIDLHG